MNKQNLHTVVSRTSTTDNARCLRLSLPEVLEGNDITYSILELL